MKTFTLLLLMVLNGFGAASLNNSISNCFFGPTGGNIINSTSAITFTMWYSIVQGGDSGYLLNKGDPEAPGIGLYMNAGPGANREFSYFSSGAGVGWTRRGGLPQAGPSVQNLAVSYVYGQSNIYTFTNGVVELGKTWANSVPTDLPDSNNTHPIRYGSRSGTSAYARGLLNELAIWNTNLTDIEMRTISNSGMKGMPLRIRQGNLVGYWGFDTYPVGSSITREQDHGPNHNNFTNEVTAPTAVAESRLSYYPNE